ncbi:MAG: YggS family pyridoxal phosphate-dependent enzyme [Clostridia bacterium]|nr:YggS family pyridoxal phosphate-dependent enzyme [Clostridia bacterium]
MDTSENSRFDHALIAERLKSARDEIASLSNGRDVKLLAVTKTVPVDVINYTIDELGITAIGENRVQELLEKYDHLHQPKNGKLEIHLIGSLQTNKVKYIIDKVDMIESVDSLKLAAEIDKQAKKHSLTMDILVEVNIGREEQKGGVMPEELYSFIEKLGEFSSLNLRGLMTIAPKCDEKSDYLKFFEKTYQYFIDISEKKLHNISRDSFNVLSMGMSGSYPEAIRAGSTEIRLGSTIFGARTYPETK